MPHTSSKQDDNKQKNPGKSTFPIAAFKVSLGGAGICDWCGNLEGIAMKEAVIANAPTGILKISLNQLAFIIREDGSILDEEYPPP